MVPPVLPPTPVAHAPSSAPHGQRARYLLAASGVLLLAAGGRLLLTWATHSQIDGDEAVVALQARHILAGERPLFFYGQHYMGSLEAYVLAVTFGWFGATGWVLRCTMTAWAVVLVGLTMVIGRRLWGAPAGLVAGLLLAVPPLSIMAWTIRARGGYVETLVFTDVLIVTTLALMGRTQRATWMAWSLLASLALWVNPVSLPIVGGLGPFVGLALWRQQRRGWPVVLLALGALVGVSPILVDAWQSGGMTLQVWLARASSPLGAFDAVPVVAGYLVHAALPLVLGIWQPHTVVPVWGPWALATAVAAGLLSSFWRLLRRADMRMGDAMILCLIASELAAYVTVGGAGQLAAGRVDATSRYLLPLAVLVPLLVGAAIGRGLRGRSGLATSAVVALLLTTGLPIVWAQMPGVFQSEYWQRLPASNAPLIATLRHDGIGFVWINHWAGTPLMFDSQEQIVTADYNDVVLHHGPDRFPAALSAVARARLGQVAYVLVVGMADPPPTPLERRLARLRVTVTRQYVPPYLVLIPRSRRVSPFEVAGQIGYAW